LIRKLVASLALLFCHLKVASSAFFTCSFGFGIELCKFFHDQLWLRWIIAGFLLQRPGFSHRPTSSKFEVRKMALGQVFI
jgi:hypothetical protein